MISFLRQIFEVNRFIILSVYGQVFFVLGIAIGVQSRRHSRLALARNFPWLAAFGIAHALHEWGDLFIPLQSFYLPPALVNLLRALQVALLASSFGLLFQFGVEMLRPLKGKWIAFRLLPLGLLTAWGWWAYMILLPLSKDIMEWHATVNALARYLIGLPGGLLAAYSFYRQKRVLASVQWIKPRLLRFFDLATLCLVLYGIAGGLIVPPAPFFPANRLNTQLVERALLVPVEVWRGLVGLMLTLAVIRILDIFRIEIDRQLAFMEEQAVLLHERARIGRELHDGTLQSVYAVGLLLRSLERECKRRNVDRVLELTHQSIEMLDRAIAEMRQYIGTLRAQPTVKSVVQGLEELVKQGPLQHLAEVELQVDIPENRTLEPSQVGHILAIVNEALSNVARHAEAQHVRIKAEATPEGLCIQIADDGRGFTQDYVQGYGLRTMYERTRLLNGTLSIVSTPGRGTTLTLKIPWEQKDEALTVVSG